MTRHPSRTARSQSARNRLSTTGARVFALVLAALTTASDPIEGWAQQQAGDPFTVHRHEIPGLIHQVWPMQVGPCERDAGDLLVLSTKGGAPDQEKWLTWMPCGAALRPGDAAILRRRIRDEAVAIDVARLPGRSGPQLVSVHARGLEIESLAGSEAPRTIAVPGGLPLPPRPWEIARLEVVADWEARGAASALVPGLQGGWLIDLVTGVARPIEMPVYASYRTWMPHLPATVWKWMLQDVTWPALERADDNGDGRPDLFALSRYAIAIYHASAEGLPRTPSRTLRLTPFDEETERSHESTGNSYFARDLDGDGRADLLLSTIGGGLTDGRSTTRVYLGREGGVSVAGPPDATRQLAGGFSGFTFVDLEGDGRPEMLETSLEFGVLQIVRVLVTRRAEARIRILALDPEGDDGTRTLFEDDFTFQLDFGENSVRGLVPTLGDWNGDGLLDFYVNRGAGEIRFRLGQVEPGKPRFGSAVGRQPVPLPGGESRVADLDGDGLDEIIAFNDRDPALPLVVFGNRGALPGTERPDAAGVVER